MKGNDLNDRTIDFNKAKIIASYKDLDRAISDNNDIISRLTRRLQTTLDSSDIIHMFSEEVKSLVDFDSFLFDVKGQETIEIGSKTGAHSCQYNLTMDEADLGAVTFTRKKRFIEEELAIIEKLASTLIFPLRNAKLYQSALQSALQDELTGCGNKRALDSNLHREADLATRHKTPLSIIMLDVDHFKVINDTMGHIAGDSVLKELANTLKQCARQSDLCFRYGGEEFLLILDDTDAIQALNIAERVRACVAEHDFSYNGKLVPTTISLGSATFKVGETLEDFKSRADQALYMAKEQGRNLAISNELPRTLVELDFAQNG